jgi:protein-S-isoprenylcysteine O-methyltransferase Ste14
MGVIARAWISLAVLAAAVGLILFGIAGTTGYWQGWIYLLLFVGMSALITVDLMRHDPELLARRLKGGPTAETRSLQRLIMLGASLGYVAMLVIPPLDVRYGWSSVPVWAVILGDTLFTAGFLFIGYVYRVNTYTSATIEVHKGQHVISTGPYGVVRHPMYASALVYLIGTPPALGSYWGYAGLAVMAPFMIWRLLDEERLLSTELQGYASYQALVRYRLVPGVW